MDLRVWQWRSPWEKRTYRICSLFYLCLLLRHQVTAAETGYSQESKNDVSDTNKLDSLSSYLPYDSREDSEYKRGSAFFPLRGKKSSSDDSLGAHQLFMPDQDDSEEKRSQFFPLRGKKVPDDLKRASYFMPMRGRKDDGWIEEDYDITDESPNKRASSFMPMRGKKKYADISEYLTKAGTYSNDVSDALNPSNTHSYQTADKRMHSFVPVRGKRSYTESENPNFQVSSTNESQDDAVSNHSAIKRSVSFMPMRGRREYENMEQTPGDITTSLLEKKAHSFMPMRGRRDDDDSPDFDKKATFMPMRGRRDDDDSSNFDKKATFMPMRGRRNDDDSQNFDKKATFMPMRGRREDGDSHYFDKKATFMPMRGRRYSDYQDFENSLDESESKRTQSFMPMRGRRTQLRDVVYEGSNAPEIESRLIEDKRSSPFMPMRGRRSLSETIIESESNLEKKVSSFAPVRSRRSTDYLENEDASNELPNMKKRVAFMPMRGRRLVEGDSEVDPWPSDQLISVLDKKSSAFMPMRGRRYEYENITVDPWQADQLMSLFNKRSSAFMPMRGRRYGYEYENITVDPWPAEELMSLFNKRSTFMPMRGRRLRWGYNNQDSNNLDYYENIDKRSSNFMPMRGRRLDISDTNYYSPYPYLMAGIGSSLMSRPYNNHDVTYNSGRSANERLKKLRINWDAVKRAFHATRGKRFHEVDDFVHSLKDSYTSGPHYAEADMHADSMDDSNKNSRTKRSIIRPRVAIQPSRQYIALKRPMSFFATRGKRLDDSAIDKLSKLR